MFRFSIREVLMAILVVVMGLGWWVDRTSILSWSDNWQGCAISLMDLVQQEGYQMEFEGNGSRRVVRLYK